MKNSKQALSSLLLLLALVGCGKEQFGGAPQSSSSEVQGLTKYVQDSCSQMTLIKPQVDILYVVDNSASNTYISSSIKNTILKTVDSISKDFDYRVIGTGVLPEGSSPNSHFQVLTNSTLSPYNGSNRILTASQFDFFEGSVSGGAAEAGLKRTIEFINANRSGSNPVFRQGANLLVVLFSNGRDTEVEVQSQFNDSTTVNTSVYNARLASLRAIKTNLSLANLRMLSVTAHSACQSGWKDSSKSYKNMAKSLYLDSGATDSSSQDSYDLCSSSVVSGVFQDVNRSIQKVIIPHKYLYWPITFTSSDNIDLNTMQVRVGSSLLVRNSEYTYIDNASLSTYNTRISPSIGEPTNARHLIQFTPGNEVEYPNCVTITSSSKVEYFGYIVLPREPKPETIVVRINGVDIPKSGTNGWSYIGNATKSNVKVQFAGCNCDLTPAIPKSGFMIQLNGTGNYYKSGDSVEAFYVGSGI